MRATTFIAASIVAAGCHTAEPSPPAPEEAITVTIPMELPPVAPASAAPRAIALSIDASGSLAIDAEPIDDDQLRPRVRQYLATLTNPAEARATIHAERGASHGRLVYLLDALRTEGIARYALNVDPDALAP